MVMVLAVGVRGRDPNGPLDGGVRVFGRDGQEWVPMGSIIEGAAAGDLAGASVVTFGERTRAAGGLHGQ